MGKSSMAIFLLPENQCELVKMLVSALETKNYLYSKLNLQIRETEMFLFSRR